MECMAGAPLAYTHCPLQTGAISLHPPPASVVRPEATHHALQACLCEARLATASAKDALTGMLLGCAVITAFSPPPPASCWTAQKHQSVLISTAADLLLTLRSHGESLYPGRSAQHPPLSEMQAMASVSITCRPNGICKWKGTA